MNLLVDVSNVFNKCMTSSILLLFATCLLFSSIDAQSTTDAPPADILNWTWKGPIGSIQGSYEMVAAKMHDHPPTLASFWELGGADFSIVVWPPKYCAAVHVFFVDSKMSGIGRFHVDKEMIAGPSIKYYMPTGKIVLDPTGSAPKNYFNQRSSIAFKHTTGSNYVVSVTDSHVDKIKKYNDATKGSGGTKVEFNLSGKSALLLTNSRFCFAHITKDGGNGDYQQLINAEKLTNKKPIMFTTYKNIHGIESLFNPIDHLFKDDGKGGRQLKSPKTVDLLPSIAKPIKMDTTNTRAPKPCNGFVTNSRDKNKRAVDVVTADSFNVAEHSSSGLKERDEHFIVAIGPECSWIRLWITAKDNNMDTYEKNMKLSETIDLFFDQQFFVGPDSDEARPLSGNSSQIDRISIRRHWIQTNPGASGLVQMSYGRDGGPSLPYIEYFHMPSLSQQNFRVNLIKAPKCEAHVMTAPQTRLASANQPPKNIFKFLGCQKYFFENKNMNDVADK